MCSADERSHTPHAVEGLWERIKAQEKQEKAARKRDSGKASALDGVPVALPALTRALKLQAKASKVGFDWNDPRAVLSKIREEADEIEAALDRADARRRRTRRPKSAICCSPRSTWRGICAPIRKPCCGKPTKNSSAALPRSNAPSRRGAKRRRTRRSLEMDALWDERPMDHRLAERT